MKNNSHRNDQTRRTILQLLWQHQSNVEKFNRIQSDPIIKEWKTDYMMRKSSGGIVAETYEPKLESQGKHASIEEALMLEKSNVFDHIHQIELRIQVVRLLMLSLREEYVRLIELRYFNRLSVEKVCEALFCSRSTFYRRHDLVLEELVREFDRLFTEEDRKFLLDEH